MTIHGTKNDDDLNGTGADNQFDLSQGGEDIAHGLGGDDHFYFGKAWSAGDQVFGGNGFDDVALRGHYAPLTFDATNISGVEGLSVGDQFTYQITVDDDATAAGKTFVFNASFVFGDHFVTFNGSAESDGRFDITGSPGGDTLRAGAGDDTIFGDEGDDVMYAGFGEDHVNGGNGTDRTVFVGDGAFDAGDRVIGGSSDTIELDGNYSGGLTITRQMAELGTVQFDGGHDYNVVLQGLDIGDPYFYISQDLHAGDAFQLDAHASGAIIFQGGDAAEAVLGGKGYNDYTGHGGADVLTANDHGPDVFNYLAVSDSYGAQYDTVVHFDAKKDFFDPHIGGINEVPASFARLVQGKLDAATFNHDLHRQIDAGELGADGALLFKARHGDLAGQWFLIVDGDSTAGYQGNDDLVVFLQNPEHIGNFDITNFGTAG